MNDTVQKLMELADEYADRAVLMAGVSDASNDVRYYRQALQDELTRLFTPQDPAIVGLAIHDAEHAIKSAAYAKWSADNATAHAAKVTEAIAKALHVDAGESK